VFVPGGSMTGISRKLPDVERQRLKKILKDHLPEPTGSLVACTSTGSPGFSAFSMRLAAPLRLALSQLPGRYLVFVPGGSMTGISRKLPDVERQRLKKILKGLGVQQLRRKRLALGRLLLDLLPLGAQAVDVVGQAYVTYVAPDLLDRVHRWDGDEDLFAHYRVDDQIFKALESSLKTSRTVLMVRSGSAYSSSGASVLPWAAFSWICSHLTCWTASTAGTGTRISSPTTGWTIRSSRHWSARSLRPPRGCSW
jgi:hypothetical protein